MKKMAAVFAILLSSIAFATPDVLLKITGTIVENETPVSYATISVLSLPDSNLVTGAISDDNGEFEIPGLKKGNYILKIDFLGYSAMYKNIGELKGNLDIGNINLQQNAQKLDAVTITGQQRIMEVQIDKKVYNVDKDPSATGATGLEVLQNAPSVEVDVDGNISLRGDQGVNILVNGRPLNIPAKQFLEQTPAANIEKIEVITNPSAKYNPEGTTGLINIILKKNTQRGLNGSVSTSLGYGLYAKNNNSINLNYRVNKINAYVNVGNNNSKRGSGGTTERSFTLANDSSNNQFIDEDNYRINESFNLKSGVDYFFNDKNVFYISGSTNGGSNEGVSKMNSFFYDNSGDNLNSFSKRVSNSESDNSSYNLNAGWQKKFSKQGHTLDLDLNYSEDNNDSFEDNEEIFKNGSDASTLRTNKSQQKENSNGSLFFAKLDYALPINDSLKFEAGLNYTNNVPEFDLARFNYNDSLVDFELDRNLSNTFGFTRNILAFYSTLSYKQNKWGYKLGLRAENTSRDTKLASGENYNKEYLSFFPSGYVSYQVSKITTIQASYSRRLQRPRLHQLNPFVSSTDPYNTRNGNPDLNPEFINIFELGATNYWKKFNLTSTVYHRKTNDLIRRFLTLSNEGVNNVSYKNQSESSAYGAEFILSYTPNKKFRANVNFNSWMNKFVLDSTDQGGNSTLKSYNINSMASYKFDMGLSVQANIRYNARYRVQQGVIDPRYGLDLSARLPVLNKKGTISVRATDVLNTRNFAFRSQNLDYEFDILRKWETRVVYVSFTYSFGKQFKGREQKRSGGQQGSTRGGSGGF